MKKSATAPTRNPKFGPKFGLGLRQPHYDDFFSRDVPVDFVEVISENFMVDGGFNRDILRRIRELHPVMMHGVSMSLGSVGGLDGDYLRRLKALVDEVDPVFVSDHLCWTRIGIGHDGFQSHDLLPMPYTDEAMSVLVENIDHAQSVLGRNMLIENPSSYISFTNSEVSEWELLSELVRRTGCELLLDVNNIFVSTTNHGWDAREYIAGLPMDKVRQIHLAGHVVRQLPDRQILIDTHSMPIRAEVWDLFGEVMERVNGPWVMIERDENIPPLDELLDELSVARERAMQWA